MKIRIITLLVLLSLSYITQAQKSLVKDIIQSIPSPLEISSLIKEAGSAYQPSLLNNHSSSKYNTSFKKAINLGIYATDLGFANIYERNQDALKHLSSVKRLADGLAIGQFFVYYTLIYLSQNKSNPDELLNMTTSNFEKINFHLRKQKRDNISILILAGGWLEAIHLICNVYKQTKSEVLRDKIGDQKIVLDQILLVLDSYKSKPEYQKLIDNLVELQKIYHTIKVETEYKAPTLKEVNGIMEVQDNSVSKIYVEEKDITNITNSIRTIRLTII